MMFTRAWDYWITMLFLLGLTCMVTLVYLRQGTNSTIIKADIHDIQQRTGDLYTRAQHDKWCVEAVRLNPGWKCPALPTP